MVIKKIAYPKVNLFLAVGNKRPDGFHEISTIFYLVKDSEYCDSLTINIEDSKETEVKVSGLEGVADCVDNTMYKAASLFLKEANITARVLIDVEKKIPSQAGLGGGSSDAAEVIKALCEYHEIPKSVAMKIALEVGSDVPFFVSGFDAAAARGRGEDLEALPSKNIRITLYPNKNEKMSTKEAYDKLDARKNIMPLPSKSELAKMYSHPVKEWKFYNDFELVNKKSEDPRMKLTGSGTCRYTIDLMES